MLSDGDIKTHRCATHRHATHQHATYQHATHGADEAIVRSSPSPSLSLSLSLRFSSNFNRVKRRNGGVQRLRLTNRYLQFAAGISTPIPRVAAPGGRPAATGCVAGTWATAAQRGWNHECPKNRPLSTPLIPLIRLCSQHPSNHLIRPPLTLIPPLK